MKKYNLCLLLMLRQYVTKGDKVPKPETSTYAGLVLQERNRIALTYTALKDLEVIAADIQNANVQV